MVSQLTPNSEVQGSNPYLPSLYMYIYLYIYLSSHRTPVRRMPPDVGGSIAGPILVGQNLYEWLGHLHS